MKPTDHDSQADVVEHDRPHWRQVHGVAIAGVPHDFELPPVAALATDAVDALGNSSTVHTSQQRPDSAISEEACRSVGVPKVSIYIPAFNAALYLRAAIDSVLGQDYESLELVVVDDGSTDATPSLLAQHYGDEPRVRWWSQSHGGIACASNAAVGACQGQYVGQLDADDMLLPHAVRTLAEFLDTHPLVGCVYSSYTTIDRHGTVLGPRSEWPIFSREKLSVKNIVHHFRMFRKHQWLRTAGFDPELSSAVDYDLFLKLSEVCPFVHIPEVLYQYRLHDQNISLIDRTGQLRNHVQAMQKMLVRTRLDHEWEVHIGGPMSEHWVEYRRRR